MMCNEAAAHLCRLHPMLLVADRAERLEAAQAVVRKVEKETQKRQRSVRVSLVMQIPWLNLLVALDFNR